MWRDLKRPITLRSTVKAGGDVAACGASDRVKNHDR